MRCVAFKFLLCRVSISLLCFLSAAQCFSLTLLHTNDNHGRFEETDSYGFMCSPSDAQAGLCFGGVARRATMIKRIRSHDQNVLLVSAGDVFTGTLWYQVYRGNATQKFMNELGYDAMTLGNHEFDDGVDNLVSFLSQLNFPVLISNLNVSQEPRWPKSPQLFTKYKILNIGGENIGLVGYVLQSTLRLSKPGPGSNIKFLPEVESVREAVEELKRQSINKIIAVGHAGIEMDKKVAEVNGIDIVVGGHTNTFLYTGKPPSTEKPYGPYPLVIKPKDNPDSNVLVVQDFAYGKYLGHLKVDFDDSGQVTGWSGNPLLLNSTVPKDHTVSQEVQKTKPAVAKFSEVKVGESFVFLDAGKPKCMLKECNLGNVATDAMVFHYSNQSKNNKQWTVASIAIQNIGSITASIDPSAQGAVTYGHIVNSFPYKNTVDIVELAGKDLVRVFEQVATKYDAKDPSSSFLQVSGLQLKYDMSKQSGHRVIDIQVRCAVCTIPAYDPLDQTATYRVIMSSYLARGGAGLSVIREKKLTHRVGNITDDIVITNYFKAKSPVMTGVENRIAFVQKDDKKEPACVAAGSVQSWNVLLVVATTTLSSIVKHIMFHWI